MSTAGGANDPFSLARHNRYDVLKQLLATGELEVESTDAKGNTILLVACQNGLRRIAKLALRHGASMDTKNDAGNTALHFCFMYGFADTLGDLLLQAGADDSIRNERDQTCYECQLGKGGEFEGEEDDVENYVDEFALDYTQEPPLEEAEEYAGAEEEGPGALSPTRSFRIATCRRPPPLDMPSSGKGSPKRARTPTVRKATVK